MVCASPDFFGEPVSLAISPNGTTVDCSRYGYGDRGGGRLVEMYNVFGDWSLPDGTFEYLVALFGLTEVDHLDQRLFIGFLGL